MKFLRQPQAVRQHFLRAHPVVRFCQREIAVADQIGVAQHRQHRHRRARVQRGHRVGGRFGFRPARGNRFRIIQQFHQLQSAAARRERVARAAHSSARAGVPARLCRRQNRTERPARGGTAPVVAVADWPGAGATALVIICCCARNADRWCSSLVCSKNQNTSSAAQIETTTIPVLSMKF